MKTKYLLIIAVALTGCTIVAPQKDDSVFYSLSSHSSSWQRGQQTREKKAKIVDLFIDEIPPYADCPSIATSDGNNQIKFSQTNRWSAPFADECSHALEENISSLLSDKIVVISSTHSDGSMILCDYRVSISIDDFIYNEKEKQVVLKTSWSFFDFERKQQIYVQKFSTSVAVETDGYDGVIVGMKSAMEEFAKHLNEHIGGILGL